MPKSRLTRVDFIVHKQTNVETVLLANRVPNKEHLYVVGPFAGRVSFSSQQMRALNLVWAINEELRDDGDNRGLQGKDVAVIGGGLAGVTCCVALAAHGADSWGFEKGGRVLDFIGDASHRNVHPTINFWPREKLIPTTELPFLNWIEGSCNKILDGLREEWDKFKSLYACIRGFDFGQEVIGLKRVEKKWQLAFSSKSKVTSRHKKLYDAVILCTGFGREKHLSATDSAGYWDSQGDLIVDLQTVATNPFQNVVVSGTGDGGLIEMCRILFPNFRAGQLLSPSDLLQSDEKISSRILSIEARCQRMLFDSKLNSVSGDMHSLRNKISRYLWEAYNEIFEDDLPDEELLGTLRHKRTNIERVILLGKRDYPFELDASPYHKFFTTLALREGWVSYYQVKEDRDVQLATNAASDETSTNSFERYKSKNVRVSSSSNLQRRKSGKVSRIARRNVTSFANSFYLARHGYESPLESIEGIRADDVLSLVKKCQQVYENKAGLTPEQFEYYATKLNLDSLTELPRWATRHLSKANEYFKPKGIAVRGHCPDPENPASTRYVLEPLDPEAGANVPVTTLPSRFLGVPVEHTITETFVMESKTGFDR